ncbi:MAG TPA: molybdenum cofactor biosynthesis protein MoaE [Nitrospiria bacterium]|nr:molybdenum cofactor biosynthesis protein MoaE [Nitrospiria bacterium]
MVKVRLFAKLKDLAGRPEIDLKLSGPTPLKGLWSRLRSEIPEVMEWVGQNKVLVAVNREMATEETLIRDGDEIGLMPPFSGGGPAKPVRRSAKGRVPTAAKNAKGVDSGGKGWTRIQTEDFSLDDELRRLKAVSSRIGAVAAFVGTARDFSKDRPVTRLSYDHYAGLAEKTLAGIRRRALKEFSIIEVCMVHRTGEIPIGGNIVLILAAAEHRDEAFRACRWCIDELKATVPIWKSETTPQGEIWVEPRP